MLLIRALCWCQDTKVVLVTVEGGGGWEEKKEEDGQSSGSKNGSVGVVSMIIHY